jgi:hypothetical protein
MKSRIKKRLFLTATPRHIDIRHRDKEGEFRVYSMDDETVYGPRAHTLSQKAIICPYKVIISLIDKETVNDFELKQGITIVNKDEIAVRRVADLIATKQAIRAVKARKIITFHSRVELAQVFASNGPKGIAFHLKGYDVRHVNGMQSSAVRDDIMRTFAGEPKAILTNARCLTEGVNIPAVDMVAFVNPRRSRIDIAQAVGRAMRKPRGPTQKKIGYVVVPLFAGTGKNDSIEKAVESDKFDVVADVVNALQEHDEELVDIIREIKERKGAGKPFKPRLLVEKVGVLGPRINLKRLAASISIEICDRVGSSWDEWLGVLMRFKSREGHCLVPHLHLEGTYRLGQWVNVQRNTKDTMPPERKRRLEAIGFVWDVSESLWEEGFAALKKFQAREGHCRVPAGHVEGTYRLASWVGSQRANKDTMPAERKQRLNAIGFVWDAQKGTWEEGFAALTAFKAREGHCLVPKSHVEGTFKLGAWVSKQRGLKHTMPAERRHRLNVIGFVWDLRESEWEEGFAALAAFKAREGHCLVPTLHVEGKFNLGFWVSNLRTNRGRVPAKRRQRLDAIGFVWDPLESGWEEGFAALAAFKAREGHCLVPQRHVEGTFKLGTWVNAQRRCRDRMPADRRQRLNAIGFVWDALSTDPPPKLKGAFNMRFRHETMTFARFESRERCKTLLPFPLLCAPTNGACPLNAGVTVASEVIRSIVHVPRCWHTARSKTRMRC